MRHVLRDENGTGLTKTPSANAPNAPIMENYGKNDEDVLEHLKIELPNK